MPGPSGHGDKRDCDPFRFRRLAPVNPSIRSCESAHDHSLDLQGKLCCRVKGSGRLLTHACRRSKKAPPKRGLISDASDVALISGSAGRDCPARPAVRPGRALGLLTRVALLAALTGLLRLLIRVALLAALVRVALVLLSTLVLVSHLVLSFCCCWLKHFNALHMGSRLQLRHVFLVIRPLRSGLAG
jgi:hypothetical protein